MTRQQNAAAPSSGSDTAAIALFDTRESAQAGVRSLAEGHPGMTAVAVADFPRTATSGAFSAALFRLGIPEDSACRYEEAIKADQHLVIVPGIPSEVERARPILLLGNSARVEVHEGLDMSPETSRHHRPFFTAR